MRLVSLLALLLLAILMLGCTTGRGAELPPQDMLAPAQDMLAMATHDHPLTYAEAYRRSLAENRPLVCWIGAEALCPPCVRELTPEAVHYIGPTFDGVADKGLVVYVPDAGQLWYAGTITQWVVGDRTYGHTPSIRRAISRWRSSRAVVRGGYSTVETVSTGSVLGPPPMAWQPFRMRGNCGPGGCR